jgi:hypothetical protein
MILVGMLDLNARVPPRLQIVHEAILLALQINEARYYNCGGVYETLNINETQNIHGTRLALCQSSLNPSGTIRCRADYFFPMGSLVS